MSNEEDVITEPGKVKCRFKECTKCGAPVDDKGNFAARSEGHSSGSRDTRSSWWDDLNNWLNQFLANPGYRFLVFLFAFMCMFAIFMVVFLGLFVIVYFK